MKPSAKRALVSHVRTEHGISTRRACGLIGLWESSLYYRAKGRNDEELRAALNKYATENQGWGYRGLMDWLVRHIEKEDLRLAGYLKA